MLGLRSGCTANDRLPVDEHQYNHKYIVITQIELFWINDAKRQNMVETAAIDMDVMRQGAQDACSLMRVLANPDRLMLLCQLAEGERRRWP